LARKKDKGTRLRVFSGREEILNRVISKIPFKETNTLLEAAEGWKSISRIDTPMIGDLLHDYSAYSSRVGTQSIPNEVIQDLVNKIIGDAKNATEGECGQKE
jgi:hypothetical protein